MNDDVHHEETEPTKEESKSIKAIVKDTVHQICSGQVVLSLAVAVKELVENSIDAGASLVEIKLHNQGLDSVEVSDNGRGVEESNIEAMTAKYHTSKLREFIDLQGVETFGFRGEALSSLCALSDMTIATRHSSTNVGLRIELDHDGRIKKKAPCARTVGTTVTLSNLFSTLPVRKREFARNIKKEFAKMCQILQGYCLVSKGVRIICSNYNSKGSKSVILTTHGSTNFLDNIQSVFGSKQVADLVKLKSPFEEKLTAASLADLNETDSSFQVTEEDIDHLNAGQFNVEGWVSSCEHSKGRGSKDRQYFFINSRPCDPKNVSKVVNQIYHRYNQHQNPFIFLNVTTDRSQVDVNLTPDKRQLLINNEKILLLAVKKALLNTYGNIPSTYKKQNNTLDTLFSQQLNNSMSINEVDSDNEVKIPANTPKFLEVLSKWKATGDTVGPCIGTSKSKKRKTLNDISERTAKMKKIQKYLTNANNILNEQQNTAVGSYKSESDSEKEVDMSMFDSDKLRTASKDFDNLLQQKNNADEELVKQIDCKTISISQTPIVEFREVTNSPLQEKETEVESLNDESVKEILPKREIILDSSDSENDLSMSACNEIKTSVDEIRTAAKFERDLEIQSMERALNRLKFKSRIDPNQNKLAEEELSLEISKDMFVEMEIIGQFNLGFIIVSLGSDLLIVDQHATDEKYNFEELQSSTVLQYQKLAVPQRLEMTADSEIILMDNLDIFEKNGFKFEIDEKGAPTKRVRLIGKPFSKNWEFGKDDIDELIFMLRDAPKGFLCRPSRIRAMFASRACRKSIMIGTALNEATMRTLINHMGEIDQPWNCPHGRPTMRHLVNTDMLLANEDIEDDNQSEACTEGTNNDDKESVTTKSEENSDNEED